MNLIIKKKKIWTMLLVMFIFSCIFTVPASAATTPRFANGYYLAEGVGHLDYYITPNAVPYTNLINNAANNWVYTGFGANPIYMYRTYNFNASNMDIYDGDYYQVEMDAWATDAKTIHVDVRTTGHIVVWPTTSMWDYGRIYLNKTRMDVIYSDTVKQGIISHEMGHVMALAHNITTTDSVMFPYTDMRTRCTVGKVDNDGINAIY